MASSTATKLVSSAELSQTHSTDLVLNARVELYACLQLLTDRARFLTGAAWAAIALRDGNQFVYRAASGSNAPEVGSVATTTPHELSKSNQPKLLGEKSLVVTIVRNSECEGLFEIVRASEAEFSSSDHHSLRRLTELVTTALDHMDAAEFSEKLIFSVPDPKPREVTLLWHAPEGPAPAAPQSKPANIDAPSVQSCVSCGFPVSNGRNQCMDCEERGRTSSPGLLNPKKSESWISAHGYTIATVLVSALAAAIIYWLR
ncbi:MAG TPA: hypothetical protein VJ731_12470 [Terriglobales bacterium]|nr:hypothetical protein [Terriglobales bacterium]